MTEKTVETEKDQKVAKRRANPTGTSGDTERSERDSDAAQTTDSSNNQVVQGWTEKFSAKSNRKYWKNSNTGETTWKDPFISGFEAVRSIPVTLVSEVAEPVKELEISKGSDQEEWIPKFSAKRNKNYWKNRITNETTWNDPTLTALPVALPAAPPVQTARRQSLISTLFAPDEGAAQSDPMSVSEKGVLETVQTTTTASSGDLGDWLQQYSEKHSKKFWKNTKTGEK